MIKMKTQLKSSEIVLNEQDKDSIEYSYENLRKMKEYELNRFFQDLLIKDDKYKYENLLKILKDKYKESTMSKDIWCISLSSFLITMIGIYMNMSITSLTISMVLFMFTVTTVLATIGRRNENNWYKVWINKNIKERDQMINTIEYFSRELKMYEPSGVGFDKKIVEKMIRKMNKDYMLLSDFCKLDMHKELTIMARSYNGLKNNI